MIKKTWPIKTYGHAHAAAGFVLGFVLSAVILAQWACTAEVGRNAPTVPSGVIKKTHLQAVEIQSSVKSAYSLAEASYVAHAAHIGKESRRIYDSEALMSSYLDPNTLDQQRHGYMLSATKPLVEHVPGSYWLTIGDLRFGSDALYLKRHGARVMATDLDDSRLQLASSRGYFSADEISAQNVEALKFKDDTFDYVLCKEAFHHFPRPMMGFYEMLRVAKRGVLIIEPQDVQNAASSAGVIN